ncbi:hypothetical protein [Planctomyces sp. SH-PL14]|uniref:hypothetical protein n=1 Tax=Planctomyces sp. SH-PL14 TaxID=1632864 RepID=UPI00078EBA31|nr:hypothetical protein [Planctomyces sp. SH-PL14]AMV18258.1 hypothetical protein VT03_10240 [Planctomyces sp. SH-PL14]
MTSITVGRLGVTHVLEDLRVRLPKKAIAVARRGLRAAVEEIRKGIAAAVPKARTRGHSEVSVQQAIGGRVWSDARSKINAKVGVGVGKKRGTYRPNAVFLATGTQVRWTGSKGIREKITERVGRGKQFKTRWVRGRTEQTGNARKYRGRVLKSGMVPRGVGNALPLARRKFVETCNRAFKRAGKLSP